MPGFRFRTTPNAPGLGTPVIYRYRVCKGFVRLATWNPSRTAHAACFTPEISPIVASRLDIAEVVTLSKLDADKDLSSTPGPGSNAAMRCTSSIQAGQQLLNVTRKIPSANEAEPSRPSAARSNHRSVGKAFVQLATSTPPVAQLMLVGLLYTRHRPWWPADSISPRSSP